MTALDDFLEACAAEISRRVEFAEENRSELADGAAVFDAAVKKAAPITREPTSVPVAAQLGELAGTPLVELVKAAADEISWTTSSRTTDAGTQTALAPLHEVRDFGELNVGLMLLGSGCSYPEHSHPPQELYLPITDGGQWMYGGNPDYRELGAETLVYNHPNGRHGAHALRAEPLLALYVLWPPSG